MGIGQHLKSDASDASYRQYVDNIFEEDLGPPPSNQRLVTGTFDFSGPYSLPGTAKISSTESTVMTHDSDDSGYQSLNVNLIQGDGGNDLQLSTNGLSGCRSASPHQCHDCGRVMSSKSSLKRHTRSETACPRRPRSVLNWQPFLNNNTRARSSPGFFIIPIPEEPTLEDSAVVDHTPEQPTCYLRHEQQTSIQTSNAQASPLSELPPPSKHEAGDFLAAPLQNYKQETSTSSVGPWYENEVNVTHLSGAVPDSRKRSRSVCDSLTLPPILNLEGISKVETRKNQSGGKAFTNDLTILGSIICASFNNVNERMPGSHDDRDCREGQTGQ